MHKKLLALLVIVFAYLPMQYSCGQTVTIPDSAIWNEEYIVINGGSTLHHSYFGLHAAGDTLIDGQQYVKLIQIGVDSISTLGSTAPPVAMPIDRYIAGIRADEVALAWYVWFDGYAAELLLYDFDLSIGDELTGTWGDCSAGTSVTSIDSVLLAGTWHKKFHLSAPYRFIIEGVGGSAGLFGYLCQAIEEYGCLNTYEISGDELIVDGCGSLSTGIAPLDAGTLKTAVYPNPTAAIIHLGPDAAGRQIQVFDQTGRFVRQFMSDATGSIDLSALNAGMYLVQWDTAIYRIMKY